MKKISITYILILFQLYFVYIKSINVINSEIYKKKTNILGTDYNFAVADVELSEDLYLYDTISCPISQYTDSVLNDYRTKGIDCGCDFTQKSICPAPRNSSCTNLCQASPYLYTCDGDWIVIDELDKVYTYTTNSTMQFRYKADVTSLYGISLKVEAIDGHGTVYMGTAEGDNFPFFIKKSSSFQKNLIFKVCPSENALQPYVGYQKTIYTSNTYFINVKSESTNGFKFSLKLKKLKVPEGQPPVCAPSKDPKLSNHTCISLGQQVYSVAPIAGFSLYFFPVETADYYYFNFPSFESQVSYYISKNPNNIYPSSGNSDWEAISDENYLLLYLEPIDENTPLNIYITVFHFTATSYLFSITNYGNKTLYPISSLPSIQAGYLNLIGTSKLILSDGTQYSTVGSLKSSLSILYPQSYLQPLWPPSSSIFDYGIKIENYEIDSEFKSKSYQIAFLLDKTIDGQFIQYQDFNSILNSSLIIDSTLFDSNGKPVKLNIKFNKGELTNCDYSKFQNINSRIYELKKNLSLTFNQDEITNLIYNLGILKMNDAFYVCQNKIDGYFKTETVRGYSLSKNCPYSNDNPLWATNPCCNETYSYYQCCVPTQIPYIYTVNSAFNNDLITDQCNSVDCTISVLTDYNRTLSSIDDCSVPQNEMTQIGLDAARIVRKCKDILVPPYCTTNLDCKNQNYSNTCDLYQRKCLPDFEYLDKKYIKCVLDGLPIGTLFYLINGTSISDETVNLLYDQNLFQDCVGTQSIMDRALYDYYSALYSYRCHSYKNCLDSTCLIEHDVCLEGGIVTSDYTFKINSNVSTCSNNGFCPQIPGCNTNTPDCFVTCQNNPNFCGYCSTTNSDTQCHSIANITTQEQCKNQTEICLLPNGQYYANLTDSECKQKGSCTHSCGEKCTLYDDVDSGCISLNHFSTPALCQEAGGIWLSLSTSACYLPSIQNEISCNALKTIFQTVWVDCGSRVRGECSGPLGLLQACKIKPVECQTEEECLNAGSCSDEYYFSFYQNNNLFLPDGLGKCVYNHSYIVIDVSCQFVESDSPEGCYFYTTVSYNGKVFSLEQSQCEAQGGRWWYKAQSKQECESKFGCKVLEPSYSSSLPYNFKWNEMSEQECNACGSDTFNQWSQKYQWTQAQWLPGISVKPQWLSRQYVTNQIKNNVFSYESFYSKIKEAVGYQNSELYRTEAFCRIDRIQTSMNSLTCSCGGSNEKDGSCFDSSAPIIGQIKVCSELTNDFKFDFGSIYFDLNSINQTCTTIIVSQVTKEIYTSILPESLASNFVSYNKPDNYAVVNMNEAVIGTLLGDGLAISSDDGINKATICFKISLLMDLNSDKYPILDFAIQDSNSSLPIPMEVQIFKSNISNTEFYCSNITNISKGVPVYFFINRVDGWINKDKILFNQETKGLMYTLAVLFLLVALFGFIEIAFIVYKVIRKKLVLQLIQILIIFVTMFITIRSIYFFLLVDGKLQDAPVADYILVVLPTFIYFTSFTIIIAIWYVIVFLVLKNNISTTTLIDRLYTIIISVNSVLYLFFIVIVLVFQYTKEHVNNDCGSRIFIPTKTSAAQKAISLAYAIVQAFLSLIIGAAFIYLGGTLYKRLNGNNNIKKKSKSNHQDKIFTLSIICSIAFILHCAFVLVLVTNINSMVFSFIGLTITEIIPALAILYIFNPFQKEKRIQGKTTSGSGSGSYEIGSNEMETKNSSNPVGANSANTNGQPIRKVKKHRKKKSNSSGVSSSNIKSSENNI